MDLNQIVNCLHGMAWGPWMVILLVGTGIYLTVRVGFIQFSKFGYVAKNTLGKLFHKQTAAEGEVTPFQALTTALAATVGTGNIAGVIGAIAIGGPGAVFWMWVTALFGMIIKYTEVVLAVQYRERNAEGEWVGGPMYYIRNGLGKKWNWLAVLFCLMGSLAAFGIGNMAQVNTIANAINYAIDVCGGNTGESYFYLFGQVISGSSIVVGGIVAFIVALTLFGGVKRIGSVTAQMVPVMAMIFIGCGLAVICSNVGAVGNAFAMIFKGAFSAESALGGAVGITIMTTIQKGVGRGVFSNEAGMGSAPIAHAATSETDPVKQGFYGIFEVFMDTIVICTFTALTVLCGIEAGVDVAWGQSAGTELIAAAFATVFGPQAGSLIVAFAISLFALTTILSWSLYGTRCFAFLTGGKGVKVFQTVFVFAIMLGAALKLDLVWNIAETLNGFMAIPNLVALLGLSGVVIKLTKDHFSQ